MASTMFFTTIGQGQTVEAFVTFSRQNVKLDFLNSIQRFIYSSQCSNKKFKEDKKQIYVYIH